MRRRMWRTALDRYKEAVDLCCEHIRDRGLDLRIALEPKPNEPRGDMFLPTVGHALAFIGELEWPDMVGLNPEFAHETMSGLSFSHAVAQTLWQRKLFHIDLNAQRIGKYDQDFRFGSEGIRDAFYVVKLLEDSGWDGMRHFDAHPYRTEDAAGVWDFARGACAPTWYWPRRRAASTRTPRSRTRCRVAQVSALAEPTRPAGGLEEIRTSTFDEAALAAQGYGLERLDQLVTELLLGALESGESVPLVVGVDSSTSACKVQVRDADTGALVSSGSLPHPPHRAAPQ